MTHPSTAESVSMYVGVLSMWSFIKLSSPVADLYRERVLGVIKDKTDDPNLAFIKADLLKTYQPMMKFWEL